MGPIPSLAPPPPTAPFSPSFVLLSFSPFYTIVFHSSSSHSQAPCKVHPFLPPSFSFHPSLTTPTYIPSTPLASIFNPSSMTLGLLGGGGCNGGSSGATSNEPTALNAKVLGQECSSSYKGELELGLGLSLGGRVGKAKPSSAWGECGRILTAKDFPSGVSHGPAVAASRFSDRVSTTGIGSVSGTKRTADSVSHDTGSPTAGSQVVGWPPIRAYRMNSLINQAKAQRAEDDKSSGDKNNPDDVSFTKTSTASLTEKNHLGFVKVNMDGIRIGRKVDLNSHSSYENLAQTLEDMFFRPTTATKPTAGSEKEAATKPSKLLDETSEFVLTYEDKEGDWMLVGDVPWRMFLSSVRRLRIMRTSEANGLAPTYQEKNERLRIKPI